MTWNDNIAILVDELYGNYVPKRFAENYDLSLWKGITQEDADILKNPEHEEYYEVWEEVLQKAFCELNGKKYTLHQSGDLYAIAIDDLTDEETEKFFGKKFFY